MNLSLAYNSLVWTKSGNVIGYNADTGFPAPGFRLGFPVIQNAFVNSQANTLSYLMVMPSGRRVELRQIAANTYQAVDSSYLYLSVDQTLQIMTLYATDGTKMKFEPRNGVHQCTEIKDRNGNIITVTYTAFGVINTITDTLARVVTFNYDGYNHLISITQDWGGTQHTWATFSYGNQLIYTNFGDLIVSGPYNNSTIPVLTRVNLDDGSYYDFTWTKWGQVRQIARYGGTGLQRAVALYNLPTTTGLQDDCPRFTTRTDYADAWTYSGQVHNYSINRTTGIGEVTTPDGTKYKETFQTSGYRRGLPTATENRDAGGAAKKTTAITWTQDDVNQIYPLNPRVTETNVSDDAGNSRRSVTAYAASHGLPENIYEYDGTTLLRRTQITYIPTTNYITATRRIIGLPDEQTLYDGANVLQSKVKYYYDELAAEHLTHQSPVVQHDTTNFGLAFKYRGNVTSVQRWDVTAPTDSSKSVVSKMGYNTSGSLLFQRDPVGPDGIVRQTDISYADNFSDGLNRNTLAYPTRITDPDGRVAATPFFSTVQYNYSFGAVTRNVAPHRQQDAGQGIPAAAVSRLYDSAGRIERITNEVNGAYTRYTYAGDQTDVVKFTTQQEGQGEFYSIVQLDGYDQAWATAKEHPGSAGGYSAQYFVYDQMRRLKEQSNPTEISANWQAAGDDQTAGFRYSTQTYNWQGRPLITTNQNLTTRTVNYEGCGCAGGQMVTTIDERGRKRDATFDTLGRSWRERTYYDMEGSTTTGIAATTINAYNVRDQLTSSTVNGQTTVLDYDGHGRLKTRELPIFHGTPQSATPYITYEYNNDDTLWKMTNPRGVVATYTYNRRKLVTGISYSSLPNFDLPNSLPERQIPSASVVYSYDELGNRTSMNDAPGQVDYVYNSLSQLKEETRTFDVGGATRSFTLKYAYNLSGQLASITDPWNAVITYSRDRAGQEIGVTGLNYKDLNQWTDRPINTFVSGMAYRAWGGIKHFTNGNLVAANNSFVMSYDANLRLTGFTGGGRSTQHDYYNDSLVKEVRDLHHGDNFKRTYSYDFGGRLTSAHAGGTAQSPTSPYSLTYGYDVLGRSTSRTGSHWSQSLTPFSTAYANDRDAQKTYDVAGNVVGYSPNYIDPWTCYDAANQVFTQFESGEQGLVRWRENYYDGDGAKVSYEQFSGGQFSAVYDSVGKYYYVRSSVLDGKVIAEFQDFYSAGPSGAHVYTSMSYVYLKGVQIAYQQNAHATDAKTLYWTYHNPVVGNYFAQTNINGSNGQPTNLIINDSAYDPLGGYVGLAQQTPINIPPSFIFSMGEFMDTYSGRCYIDMVESPCTLALTLLNNGTGIQAPWDPYTSDSSGQLYRFTIDWDNGFYGFVPTGAKYNGDGTWSWTRSSSGRPTLKPKGQGKAGSEADGLLFAGHQQGGLKQRPLTKEEIQEKERARETNRINVFNVALKALENSDCANVIKGSYVSDPKTFLESLIKNKDQFSDSETLGLSIEDGEALGVGNSTRIKMRKGYWGDVVIDNQSYGTYNGVEITVHQRMAIDVLHEVSHATGRYVHGKSRTVNGIIYDRLITGSQLNKDILNACFSKRPK